MCGEKMMKAGSNCAMLGSPPRMRGKRGVSKIFACPHRDHPRVCGEKRFNRDQTILTTGSPPRMRGKVIGLCDLCDRAGITPAYAGKSLPRAPVRFAKRDYPRVCGEKRYSRPLHGTPVSLEALRYTCRTRLPSRPRSCCIVSREISSSGKRS